MTPDELIRRGDPEAFAAFYRQQAPVLLGWLIRQTRDPELAADLLGETFADALDGCHRYDPRRGPAAAWLFGIARRHLGRARRRGAVEDRARRRLGIAPLELTDAGLERLERLAESEAVRAALADLPADMRAAVEARVVAERPYPQIAESLKTSESVVRKRVSRGLAGLRERMEEKPR
jgi:RNA polymerase sigma-70 factor (ECF subfamily)